MFSSYESSQLRLLYKYFQWDLSHCSFFSIYHAGLCSHSYYTHFNVAKFSDCSSEIYRAYKEDCNILWNTSCNVLKEHLTFFSGDMWRLMTLATCLESSSPQNKSVALISVAKSIWKLGPRVFVDILLWTDIFSVKFRLLM